MSETAGRQARGPVITLDGGRYYAEIVDGIPMIFRADTAGAVTHIESAAQNKDTSGIRAAAIPTETPRTAASGGGDSAATPDDDETAAWTMSSESVASSLLRKLLTGGYADLEGDKGRGYSILLDTSWLDITPEEADVARAIWKEAEGAHV